MSDNLKGPLAEVASIAENPTRKAQEAKAAGRQVVGYFAMNYPEELVHATGAFPLLIQESYEPVTAGHAYYYSFFCGPSRSLVDQGVKEQLDFLDALIVGDYCIQEIGAGEVIQDQRRNIDNLFFRLPVGNEPWTIDDIEQCLRDLKSDLERSLGVTVTEEALQNSIKVYNRNRQLLRGILALREQYPGLLTSVQMIHIVTSSMVSQKEENNELLCVLLEELKAASKPGVRKQRVFLQGSLCGAPKSDILSIIEKAGAMAVGDDLFHGLRYVSTDVEEGGSGLRRIAEHYLKKDSNVPCPTRVNPKADYPQYLVDQCKRLKVDAVFLLQQKYCEPAMFMFPDIKSALDANGIRYLLIDNEHEVVSLEALRTRVEAFIEMNQFNADMASR
jgi:benzoyl-CoA reductase subunit C